MVSNNKNNVIKNISYRIVENVGDGKLWRTAKNPYWRKKRWRIVKNRILARENVGKICRVKYVVKLSYIGSSE